jgi:tryptophan halogenase
MSLPDTLEEKLALWRRHGRVFRVDDELFGESSWVAVLEGQGIKPSGYDPLADSMDTEKLHTLLPRIRSAIQRGAEAMPRHEDFIAEHCAWDPAAAPVKPAPGRGHFSLTAARSHFGGLAGAMAR